MITSERLNPQLSLLCPYYIGWRIPFRVLVTISDIFLHFVDESDKSFRLIYSKIAKKIINKYCYK